MALYQWITKTERDRLEERIHKCLDGTGLEIDPEFSNGKIIYARDGDGCKHALNARVTIIITSINSTANEYVVEIRSSEPMLKNGTRCEQISGRIKTVVPPKP